MKIQSTLALLALLFSLHACKNDPYADQRHKSPSTPEEMQQNAIIKHLTEKGITDAQRTESGLYYVIDQKGDGTQPQEGDMVELHYEVGGLEDSTLMSTRDQGRPSVFPTLEQAPAGIRESIELLEGKGGKGRFFMPGKLAGGSPKALQFNMELMDFQDREAYMQGVKDASEKLLQTYITENDLDAKRTESGIYYVIEKPGGKEKPDAQSKVTVHYAGTLLDGSEFDSSYKRGEPATFPLNRVIPGWTEGIPLFGKGGKGTLLIPSHLAYGERGSGEKIPPNSPLRFDVEVIDFEK